MTGAACGLGACFARKLAQRGYNLVLIDRRGEELERSCAELTAAHGIVAEPFVADLTDHAALEAVGRRLEQVTDLDLLVNNAGFGMFKPFVETDVERHLDMIRVHVVTGVWLTRAMLPGMIARDRGAVVNVSSLGAWVPSAGNVMYASTKSYLAVFSEAIQEELRGSSVRVQALCPGFVRTEFHDCDGMAGFDRRQIPGPLWMSPEDVVDCSLRSLSGKRVIVVPGLWNRVLAGLVRRSLLQPLVRFIARPKR
ncbi:MAG TPA: SDR family oxidoreductase [Polyangia bacterium]|nr:SDR family oxidoreductase [Polyangia bacterium]